VLRQLLEHAARHAQRVLALGEALEESAPSLEEPGQFFNGQLPR
jgi:hypothetical protein